ncbi:MAG: anaerobic ribonucleoside-triphosphate reductase, partial [Eubacteriales bacterium]|nr:anaerobic ribonucleoside-triphosphate reductase [Eubacteriales bacterium]
LDGGFEMGNLWYNEPKTLSTAFNVIGDIILSTASQQYGGFTIPEIDKILDKYANMSFLKYKNEIKEYLEYIKKDELTKDDENFIEEKALLKVKRDFEQGFQGMEYKLNSVGSSRGDYPFVTFSIGLGKTRFSKMASDILLNVHKNGQGKEGHKKPVLFPKIVFLYDEELHGEGKELEDIFNSAIECSSKTMYPDYLSLSGDSYVAKAYKKYNTVISPMGCRAFLSLWFEKGGKNPLDENDKAISVGRFNVGVVSLHLPMIYSKAKFESKPFYEVLDYYLEMIRKIHLKTIDYLGEMKASTNPMAYCEGGFYGGNLKPTDKIKPLLKSATASFGITALNELQQLHNKKSIFEDGNFALETMEYINKKIEEFKKEDDVLYAIYGTPAESLCGLQIKQFRKKYGIIENVSDREYVSNSFHTHVSEDITPTEKQDSEKRFWDFLNGGKIQYVKYPINYNFNAMKSLIKRAMELGFYEGVNLSLSYCDDCGHSELGNEKCSKCGSENLTKIDRMNGYLSYSRIHGDTRLNSAKMSEIKDRKSM